MEEKTFTDFCAEWNERQPKDKDVRIAIMPLEFSGDVYGIEIRFPGFKCDGIKFFNIRRSVGTESRGTISVSSSSVDFEKGIMSFNTSFCDHGYDTPTAIKTMKTLLTEILSNLDR